MDPEIAKQAKKASKAETNRLKDQPHVPEIDPDILDERVQLPAITSWRPAMLPNGQWGAQHDAAEIVPKDLVGRRIIITDRRQHKWTSEVLEVIERTDNTVLVRDRSRFLNQRLPRKQPPTDQAKLPR